MDLIPKPKPKNPGGNFAGSGNFIKSRGIDISGKRYYDLSFLKGKWTLLSFAAVFLTLLVFGAVRGYVFYIDRATEAIKREREAIEKDESVKLVSSLGRAEIVAQTVDKLSKDHIYTSAFFSLLEKLTLPEIKWQSLTLNTQEGTADLRGDSSGYSFLAKQITKFEEEKIQIAVSGIGLGKDGVGFSAKLEFDPDLLKK